jgi:hypothetical protein
VIPSTQVEGLFACCNANQFSVCQALPEFVSFVKRIKRDCCEKLENDFPGKFKEH